MDKEIIIKDLYLGLALRNELQTQGLRDNDYSEMEYKKFKLSELSKIKKLVIPKGTKNLDGLEYLVNLEDLNISSTNAKKVSSVVSNDAEYNYLMNQIWVDDFTPIEGLSNLKYLTISNSTGIKHIDISKLKELTVLELSSNPNLTNIKGLDHAHNLTELYLDRNSITNNFDLEKLITEHYLSNAKLDFNLFPILLSSNPNLLDCLYEQQRNGIRIKWVENFSNLGLNELTTNRMAEIHNEASKILDKIIDPNYSEMEVISAIYLYINQNIEYDYDGLEKRDNPHNQNGTLTVSGETREQQANRVNSSYNAFMYHKCVCEGYTNMMRYLLTCCGIEARTVSCSPKKQTSTTSYVFNNSNHSIIRVKIKDNWYYFDPTWDAQKNTLRFFFKTKEEFESTHILSISEQNIKNPDVKAYTNEELSVMMNNALDYQSVAESKTR